jgi:hypothetical protein
MPTITAARYTLARVCARLWYCGAGAAHIVDIVVAGLCVAKNHCTVQVDIVESADAGFCVAKNHNALGSTNLSTGGSRNAWSAKSGMIVNSSIRPCYGCMHSIALPPIANAQISNETQTA